jgi:chorismate mutase
MSDRYAELRGLIVANDSMLVAGVNERLRLVAELWQLKHERGEPMVDPEREHALRGLLAAANAGPLSGEGLDRFVAALLDLTKAELARSDEDDTR